MIAKACVSALALLCASATESVHPASLPAFTQSGIPAGLHPEVVRVDCLFGSGSAFKVGPRSLISVDHVTSLPLCGLGKQLFTVQHRRGDFSIISVEVEADKWLRVDCTGYIPGRKYKALGFARGSDDLTEVDLVATGQTRGELALLEGIFTVVPGQSGGPIVDAETGAVVGTVNTYDMRRGLSGSVELKGTAVCQA